MNSLLYAILVILLLLAIAGLALEVRVLRQENSTLTDQSRQDKNIIERQSRKIRTMTNEQELRNSELEALKAENRRLRSAGKME
jgi:hypothetical protein